MGISEGGLANSVTIYPSLSLPLSSQIASLIIPAAKQGDSGNFTCNPSNSDALTVNLHVINGRCPSLPD